MAVAVRPAKLPLVALDATCLALALSLLPLLLMQPLWVSLSLYALIAYKRFVDERPGWPRLPWFLRMALLALLLYAVAVQYGGLVGRNAGIVVLAVLTLGKLLEAANRRDLAITAAVAVFLVVVQFLLSSNAVLVVLAVVGVVAGLAALETINRPMTRGGPPGPSRLGAGQLGGVIKLLAPALPMALVLFFLFPRMSTPRFGVPEGALDGRTGLSDEMTPGSVISLFVDDRPAFRVYFDGARPPTEQLYFRGPVLWNFDGRAWRRPFGMVQQPPALTGLGEGSALRYRVVLEPHERRWLFALDYPGALPEDARRGFDAALVTREPVISARADEFVSYPQAQLEVESIRYPSILKQLPEGNPRARALAKQWRSEGLSDQQIIDTALAMFAADPFEYSLQPPELGVETVDDFVFETKSGYCEYYASAFTFLMRAAGIPARVVTGYLGGRENRLGDYLLIRHSDAHAWSEVWLEGRGWVRVDPTAAVAPERIRSSAEGFAGYEGIASFGWYQALRERLDYFESGWTRLVLEFNAKQQRQLLAPVGIPELDWRALVVMLIVGAGLASAWFWAHLRAKVRARIPKLDRLYAKLKRLAEQRGLALEPPLGPLEVGSRISARWPAAAARSDALIRAYISGRYAGQVLSAQALQTAEAHLAALRTQMR